MGIFTNRQPRRRGFPIRIVLALIVAGISLFSYYRLKSVNPVTGETQRVALTIEQENALGLDAAKEMAIQFGGLTSDQEGRMMVEEIGQRIVSRSDASKSEYRFAFHALADPETINAFALPGGQVFITDGLRRQLQTPGQLAGVLAHEIVHVVGRHSAEHIAKAQLTQGLTGAAVIATYDPNNAASRSSPAVAALIGQLINLKYGREDELESDRLGVKFMAQAGYDPRAMIEVMHVLARAGEGRARQPEFFSTHPDPGRRIEKIEEAIRLEFPSGVPAELED
jgi:predicted Zn-dependent protease